MRTPGHQELKTMTPDTTQSAGTLHVTDSRTGRSYDLPITDGAIRALDLRQIKVSGDDFGLLSYDPAFMNTASCRSAITFIDGEKGILRYRGYPIDELADNVSFLDVAYLLLRGELPGKEESAGWADEITRHTYVHENVKEFINGFHHDAHPMGILVSSIAALSTFYPGAKEISNAEDRHLQVVRLIAKMPTLAAFAYRHALGLPYAYPDGELSYAGNLLNMFWKMTEPRYHPDPVLSRALDVLFILHADHEQNCSTSAVRSIGSAKPDPYSAIAGGIGALYVHYLSVMCPEEMTVSLTVNLLVIVFLGGVGSLRGVLLGAVLFTALPEVLRLAPTWRLVIYGGLLLLVVIRSPGGLESLLRRTAGAR
jgi:citrate synthase